MLGNISRTVATVSKKISTTADFMFDVLPVLPQQSLGYPESDSEEDLLLLIPLDDDATHTFTNLPPSAHHRSKAFKRSATIHIAHTDSNLDRVPETDAALESSLLEAVYEREPARKAVCGGEALCQTDSTHHTADLAASAGGDADEEGCIIFYPEDEPQLGGVCHEHLVAAITDAAADTQCGARGYPVPCTSNSPDVVMLEAADGDINAEACPVFCPEENGAADDAALAEWGRTLMGLSLEAVAAVAHRTLAAEAGADDALTRAAAALVQSVLGPRLEHPGLDIENKLELDLTPEMGLINTRLQQLPCMRDEATSDGVPLYADKVGCVKTHSEDLQGGLSADLRSTRGQDHAPVVPKHAVKGASAKEQLHMKFIQVMMRTKCLLSVFVKGFRLGTQCMVRPLAKAHVTWSVA